MNLKKNKTFERKNLTTYETGQPLHKAGILILVVGFGKLDFRHLKSVLGLLGFQLNLE